MEVEKLCKNLEKYIRSTTTSEIQLPLVWPKPYTQSWETTLTRHPVPCMRQKFCDPCTYVCMQAVLTQKAKQQNNGVFPFHPQTVFSVLLLAVPVVVMHVIFTYFRETMFTSLEKNVKLQLVNLLKDLDFEMFRRKCVRQIIFA